MLYHVSIKNYAIIDNLDLDLESGMTVITGETGAGKSIVIDALDIALGDRADIRMLRHGSGRCEINLSFDVSTIPLAKQWLDERELTQDNDCILRRTLTKEGRTRNFINGHAVTLQQVRELGKLLVHVHGQHQHQGLVRKEEQRSLLDNYGKLTSLAEEVKQCFHQWQEVLNRIAAIEGDSRDHSAQIELLNYQIQELIDLNLNEGDVETLHQQQKKLANAEQIQQGLQRCLDHLENDGDGSGLTHITHSLRALRSLSSLMHIRPTLLELFNNSLIQLEEAARELRQQLEATEVNPQQLAEVESQLNRIHDLARKHRIEPEQLAGHLRLLSEQYDLLITQDGQLDQLKQDAERLKNQYLKLADSLSEQRKKAGKKLGQLISKSMQELGMAGGQLTIEIEKLPLDKAASYGLDDIQVLVSANPGQPLKPLNKVASGGELARIGLAIQVITAQKHATPTLVFDEVDVGIGGGIAEIVGRLMRKLGETAQVLCITHLPQVAAQGHHHLQVAKNRDKNSTSSQLVLLNPEQQVHEIARMLGGVKITPQTLAHAQEMLENSSLETT